MIDKYGYTLKQNKTENQPEAGIRYHQADLKLMTTFQLKEICRKEKIMNGIINPMDKEELIRTILRFRGAAEVFLIKQDEGNGREALDNLVRTTAFVEKHDIHTQCSSKISAYEGLAISYYDGLKLPYDKRLVGTNALVIGGDLSVCAILNVEILGNRTDYLYLTKAAGIPCVESAVKNYSLYCMGRRESERLYKIYHGQYEFLPERMEIYRIPLLDFEVKKPIPLSMPIAMDFGTTNTTAGVYLDDLYFEKAGLSGREHGMAMNEVNYAMFYDTADGYRETTLFPSVVGVLSVDTGTPTFLFGYDAIRLANSSYIDEGFCVFYDIKRWVGDYERPEEITDREGHRGFVKRKDILKAYFEYVITAVENQFKCEIKDVHVSCPVKQKSQFQKLFREILPDYAVGQKDLVDEGVSVLYNTISDMIQKGNAEDGQEYKALIIDCGGGTTDLCSCSFRVWDRRVSYQISIDTSYENGDTNFGGNNLTFRLMQLLKVAIVNRMYLGVLTAVEKIISGYDIDIFRYVDQYGVKELYGKLEGTYQEAEAYLPTKFREFENRSRMDYFKVKNNFYFLFHLAEVIKKKFYNQVGILRIGLASEPVEESATAWIPVDKWKLSAYSKNSLETVKEFPTIYFSVFEIELLLKADIYGIVGKFMEQMYEEGRLEDYSIIKLTGQSCKIGIFREALKEFVPGRTIQFKRNSGDLSGDYELKTTCVSGALKYLKDKKYGFADISIHTKEPALPYRITAYTHHGEEVVLIHRLKRNSRSGMISRNMEDLTLKLYLRDMQGEERYQYTKYCSLNDFEKKTYMEIQGKYGSHIHQADTDDIVENEVKFFIWSEPEDWTFSVVPVYRKEEGLYLGREEVFCFENDGWVKNFFDGMK